MPSASFQRLGIVLRPDGSPAESAGVVNPACARTPQGALVLLPRAVAAGNVSRVARYNAVWSGDAVTFQSDGFALEPDAPFERRTEPGGYGCEDPRVTFVPELDRYLMAYCAYGPNGARVAVATSPDALTWTRLGVVNFHGKEGFGDKDAAFFPQIITSPAGVPSFALLHRPTLFASVAIGRSIVPTILATPPSRRESICIAYMPAQLALADIRALLDVTETDVILQPDGAWGNIKVGTGTPPVRTAAGWLVMYHGIDAIPGADEAAFSLQYCAGVALLDLARPNVVLYRSPEPVLWPQLPEEREGTVDDVVFPTAIDPRPEFGADTFDIYYGMADYMIGRGRLTFNPH